MKSRSKLYKYTIRIIIVLFFLLIGFSGFYTYWNMAGPEKTCVNCHEINPSYETMASSAHRDISCFECHGTALGNGLHSLKEKSMMVFSHVSREVRNEDIHLSEEQVLTVHDRCKKCHETEYAGWLSGGHSATYSDIFLNEVHNSTEQLNADCMRCHGMFSELRTDEIVDPIDKEGPWHLKVPEKAMDPTIPCLTCHQIHSPGEPVQELDRSVPNNIFYGRNLENNSVGFYGRHEKMHFLVKDLPKPKMYFQKEEVPVTDDPYYRLCVQCHAPSVWHEVGTHDDHTPMGVHSGLSCTACHAPHSNDPRSSCVTCHPAISNCNIDVMTMNTTYANPFSENDIHFVSCRNCHNQSFLAKHGRN